MASEVKTNKISPSTSTTVTLGDASDLFQLPASAEIDIASGATLDVNGTIDLTGATTTGFPSATLAPAFTACANADVTISDATDTKVTLNREVFDSNSAFDPTTNYRFTVPAGEGGKYLIAAGVSFGSTDDMEVVRVHIKKGGSTIASNEWSCGATYIEQGLLSLTLTCVLDLSATNLSLIHI